MQTFLIVLNMKNIRTKKIVIVCKEKRDPTQTYETFPFNDRKTIKAQRHENVTNTCYETTIDCQFVWLLVWL